MAARNRVISGGAVGCSVRLDRDTNGVSGISFNYNTGKSVFISRNMVSRWTLVQSFADRSSAVKRGALGLVLFGGIGLLGAATAKRIYQIRIFWVSDMEPSLIEVDELIYNRIVREYY